MKSQWTTLNDGSAHVWRFGWLEVCVGGNGASGWSFFTKPDIIKGRIFTDLKARTLQSAKDEALRIVCLKLEEVALATKEQP